MLVKFYCVDKRNIYFDLFPPITNKSSKYNTSNKKNVTQNFFVFFNSYFFFFHQSPLEAL